MTEPNIPEDAALSSRGIVAQNLLIARTALDFTQHQLADKSGISRATIAQLEAGLGDPRLSTLELLAATLHIPAHFLLLDQASFRAVAELLKLGDKVNSAQKSARDVIAPVLQAGGALNRLRAASIGVDVAREAGLLGDAHRVGAAIGAARYASAGTFLGAHLAQLLERFRPVARPAPITLLDDDDFTMGEGI